jgi:PAS domain S-box-containing protein
MIRKPKGPGPADVERLYRELQIHQVELEEQNRELKEIQQRLEESRDRYADLYDFAPVGYVDLDGRGSIRSINLAGAHLLNTVRSRIVGNSFSVYVSPKDRGKFQDHLEKCRVSGKRESAELTLRAGRRFPVPVQLQSVVTADKGEPSPGFRMILTDMGERKRAEEALKQSEERFRTLVNGTPVGFFIAQDGKIAFRNPEQEKLFGPLPKSLKLGDLSAVHPEDRQKFFGLCGQGERSIVTGPVDIRLFYQGEGRSDDDLRWVHCRGIRIPWGGREAFLVNMLDVTHTRDLERIAQVQEKMAALGHVAAGIAHEIRNPLTGINLFLSSLEELVGASQDLEAAEKEKAGECLRQIKSSSAKIAGVIQMVMAFSRPIPPALEMADVNDAIDGAVELAQVTLRHNGVELEKSLAADLPKCRVDLHLLQQVVLNLIANADQAMDGMKRKKRLGIQSWGEGDWVVIRIFDAGPGISPRLREKVFDPYFTTKREGTGIGLSFCQRVVTGHGGVISAEQSPLGGAAFRIRLPVQGPKDLP